MDDEPAQSAPAKDPAQSPPGWYDNPDANGLRYWDGGSWTQGYHPGYDLDVGAPPNRKEVLWGLALGFGATGGIVGFLSIPVSAFYFPLGFGTAGAALCIAAITQKGDTPWYGAVAVIASVAALGLGITAYNDFDDAQSGLEDAQRQLNNLLD